MATKILTAPAQEPVSVAMVKSALRIDWSEDDSAIKELIAVAREWVEVRLGRALITQKLQIAQYLSDLTMSPLAGVIGGYHGYSVEIPRPPCITIDLVEIEVQIATWVPLVVVDDYLADTDGEPARVYLATSALAKWAVALNYPGNRPRTRVSFTAGYGPTAGTVPAAIRRNIVQVVAWMYEHRDAGAPPDTLLDTTYKLWRI